MYAVNIFINSMFKSSALRTRCLLLGLLIAGCPLPALLLQAYPASVVAMQDSIPSAVPGTDKDTDPGKVVDAVVDTVSGKVVDAVVDTVSGPVAVPVPSGPVVLSDSALVHLQSPAFSRVLDRAIIYQKKADSLKRVSIAWRKEVEWIYDPVQRGRLQKRIEQVEDSMKAFEILADEHFGYLMGNMPAPVKKPRTHPFLVRDTVLGGITVYRYNLSDEFLASLDRIRGVPKGEAPFQEAEKSNRDADKTHPAAGPAGTPEDVAGDDEASTLQQPKSLARPDKAFDISDRSPYGQSRTFERDFTIPPGVFYRIQLAVYSKELAPDHFGGLSPITTESIPGRGLTRYFVGKFTRMDDARSALSRVRPLGYPDAFIVGYYNGQKSSFSKLKALEK